LYHKLRLFLGLGLGPRVWFGLGLGIGLELDSVPANHSAFRRSVPEIIPTRICGGYDRHPQVCRVSREKKLAAVD